jgi:hypothetical protein
MSYLKRRHFLQAAGSTLAAIGLSQVDFLRQANQYGRVLAQGTPRKLALLVGINAYPLGVSPLRGCVTDVQMQKELLVHRFGFNPNDILTLTDANATRQNLLDAFENHLMQAQPGDVVVFHFSGHGSLVRDPDPILLPRLDRYDRVQGYNGTMLPYDARQGIQGTEVNDIMGKTLFLLTSALKTDQVTVMLDSCHSGGGTRGDLRFRAVESRLELGEAGPSQAEKDTHTYWREKLGWSPDDLKARRTEGIAKGVALGSAQANQLAADATFGRVGPGQFHAGAFTYALTRYLWQQPGSLPIERVFVDLARSTRDVARSARLDQAPVFMTAPGSNHGQQPLFFLAPQTPAAEAVVLGSENGEVKFWLGGISSQSLDAFEAGAIFTAIDAQGNELGQIEQTRREGLMGYGVLQGQGRANTLAQALLRERVRGVPQDLTLRLGLDPSLGNDAAAMRASLNQIRRVEPVAVNGEESPNFLIGRMTEEGLALAVAEQVQNVGTLGTLGLFTPGLVPLRDSFGPPGEAVETAVNRLVPQFQVLLAGRILRAVLNSDTSDLNMTVTVQPVVGDAVGRGASRGSHSTEMVTQRLDATIAPLTSGSEITITVTNHEDRRIYVGVLGIGSTGRITVLHPTDWSAPEDAALLEPGQSLTAPEHRLARDPGRDYCADPSDDFHLCLRGSGYVEMLTIASTEPLRDVLRAIQDIAGETLASRGQPISLREADTLNFVENLLVDIDRNTRGDVEVRGGVQAVDVTKMAAISTMIQIVEN